MKNTPLLTRKLSKPAFVSFYVRFYRKMMQIRRQALTFCAKLLVKHKLSVYLLQRSSPVNLIFLLIFIITLQQNYFKRFKKNRENT